MVHATYQRRLSALIMGVRPSAGHIYGSRDSVPVDNLTMLGLHAWRIGLDELQADLRESPQLSGGDMWIQEWVTTEIERDRVRWSDASTMLELLAVALGPASPDPSQGPRGRAFWTQWQANIDHLNEMITIGAARTTGDTHELIGHCMELVERHNGPARVLDSLASAGADLSPVTCSPAPFRPLVSAVERLQVSAVLAASYDDLPACTAAMAVVLEQRPAGPPCTADSGARRRLRGWRYGASAKH